MYKITNSEIKRTNRNNIYTTIYEAKQLSKQQLSEKLNLSMPTITQNLKELEALGLIKKEGFYEASTSGGRKARIICCNALSRISIGVEVMKEQAFIIALDLYGAELRQETLALPFQKSELYFCALGNWINRFIAELPYPKESILGVGIAVQGLVSSDHSRILYGKLVDCTDLSLNELAKYITWPCMLIHDSEAAAFTEIWNHNEIPDSLYVWLNYNLGSSMIINGEIYNGRGHLGGTLEHMTLIPNGKPCYCGKSGCAESYCSVDALLAAAGESLTDFFFHLRNSDPARQKIWEHYLHHLAMTLNNVLMVLDCDIIFSGALHPYLMESDLESLRTYMKELSPFSFYEPRLKIGLSRHFAAAVGAALYLISQFLRKD